MRAGNLLRTLGRVKSGLWTAPEEATQRTNGRNDCEAIFELDCKKADCESAVERVLSLQAQKRQKLKF